MFENGGARVDKVLYTGSVTSCGISNYIYSFNGIVTYHYFRTSLVVSIWAADSVACMKLFEA